MSRYLKIRRSDDAAVASEEKQDSAIVVAETTRDSIGGTTATTAGDTGASTTNGFLRWLRDRFLSVAPRLTYTEDWNAALTSSYQKVATTTTATKSLRMSSACNASAYDIEYAVVPVGDPAPTTNGQALLAGEDFLAGIPIGDIYARSETAQKLIVWRG